MSRKKRRPKSGARPSMKKFVRKRSQKIGLPPGSIVYLGEPAAREVRLSVLDYDAEHVAHRELRSVDETFPFKDTATVTWIDVAGLHDTTVMERIGEHYCIHPLVLEDILNTDQRPKFELTDEHVFLVLKMLRFDTDTAELHADQISLILGANYVLTFHERAGDIFAPLRERIENGKGKMRRFGPDYLAYSILDIVVDHYFLALETIGEHIEALEHDVLENPDRALVERIQNMKRELIYLRKATWPLREAVGALSREETDLIRPSTHPYLRDVHDHIVQVIDMVETFRDMISGVLDIYLSSVSNRMNEVMKVLTIIATIFIPLTFLAGIYGMNFAYMPELRWRWGYPALWAVMLAVMAGMLLYFRRRRWL